MPDSVEVWGGVECTVNRVGNIYHDQLIWNGHSDRDTDLELFASLGLKTLRYPLLWERLAPNDPQSIDWTWADRRLELLRELGIRPVIGLLHHGSGPSYTSLDDDLFPEKLAHFARQVAERYPWVDLFTPVNEPLTTARFSGLYGLWYPHGRTQQTFYKVLLNQIRATFLAMREIRKVNPGAQLFQTEDLGKVYSTPLLRYQADYENHRRWLSLDFLYGRVNREHIMYDDILSSGVSPDELDRLLDTGPCPPDLLGLNYYVTSERFLDQRLEYYPSAAHGGNGQHRYADVEFVRVCEEGIAGHQALLQEAWDRYHNPMVISEVHLGSTREEQVRWLVEAWDAANNLRLQGVDVRAITAWALLGIFNWHCLVTRDEGHYEPGIFDLRTGTPRPTVLASALRSLIETGEYHHPMLAAPGWWRRPERLIHPAVVCLDPIHPGRHSSALSYHKPASERRPLLIAGASGTLGQAFKRICQSRGLDCVALTHQEMEISDPGSVQTAVDQYRPWAIINTAGFVRVDDAERERELSWRANVTGPQVLAGACSRLGIPLLTFSSDLVFDGSQADPYHESSLPAPINHYGLTKAEAEARVMSLLPGALIIRTSAFFGPWDPYNFASHILKAISEGHNFRAVRDVTVSPTYVPDLVSVSLDLLVDGEQGIWHLANQGCLSWYDFGRDVLVSYGMDPSRLVPVPLDEMAYPASRPRNSALTSEKALLLPSLESAVARFADTLRERSSIL